MSIINLKIIALISMFIDHYGAIFQNDVDIYRIIGRIAFPIYCFLLVEGYFHTKDVKKYAQRLFIFAIISELPFDLAFYNKLGFEHQNIFFTLFIGLVTIHFLDNEKYNNNNNNNIIIIIISIIMSSIFSIDYGAVGIIYILSFYFTRDYTKLKKLYVIGLTMFIVNLIFTTTIQQFSLLSLPIIYFYNYELGSNNKFIQKFFYVAYPLHLLLFYLVYYPKHN